MFDGPVWYSKQLALGHSRKEPKHLVVHMGVWLTEASETVNHHFPVRGHCSYQYSTLRGQRIYQEKLAAGYHLGSTNSINGVLDAKACSTSSKCITTGSTCRNSTEDAKLSRLEAFKGELDESCLLIVVHPFSFLAVSLAGQRPRSHA